MRTADFGRGARPLGSPPGATTGRTVRAFDV